MSKIDLEENACNEFDLKQLIASFKKHLGGIYLPIGWMVMR